MFGQKFSNIPKFSQKLNSDHFTFGKKHSPIIKQMYHLPHIEEEKPKQSDLEKHHSQMRATHHRH